MIFLAFATVIYFFLHSLLAANRAKALLAGRLIKSSLYRLVYNAVAIGGAAYLAWVFVNTEKQPVPLVQLHTTYAAVGGALMALAGVFIGLSAFSNYDTAEFFGLQQLRSREQSSPQLNTKGWNSVVRHPLYLATFLVLWGWFLLSSFDAVLLLAVLGSVYLFIGAKLEEQKLVETFGDAYREYQQQVPMLFPRFVKRTKNNKIQ